ncbi:MAG: DUF1549 and DUF1553 domain-containing protein [Gemmataceae bacterium]
MKLSLPAVLLIASPASSAPDFDKEIAPIFVKRCAECHSGADPKAKFDITKKANVDAAAVLEMVNEDKMPPKKPLAAAEKALLKEWIAGGAKWGTDPIDPFATTTEKKAGRDWWSLQPIVRPPVPKGASNPIDAFIRAKLAEKKLEPAPAADKRTLVRRVHFDLLGLPPSFEQVEAFVQDDSPEAYEKLIDKLLASPHYGERQGRYWLDVVRYAETCGYERDQTKPNVWKYRDWVIKAFNDDMPFDRFVTEQLAGDEIPNRTEASVIATGFIRLGTWNDEPNDPNEYKYDRLEDMIGATSTAFLGLTVKCARCHDHKFDPIKQTDYYRMAGAFWAGFVEPGPRDHLGGPDAKALGLDNVFGWTDRGRDIPPIKLLKKGDPLRPGEVVPFAHQSYVSSLDKPAATSESGAKTSGRRLALAKWITDPKNPLTARVWVNRLWQYHFGFGLVRTPDNFGFTGEKPTHPELLDWLANELVEPVRGDAWAVKRLHKLIMMSDTYKQSSLHPKHEGYAKLDAANRFWWRAERRRLDAESLRDALLFAGGRLKLEPIGGPSFAPAIAPDALEGLSTKSAAWKPSPPDQQGRRSVYIFAKRGLLPPLLTTFDFPDTTLPSCQRDATTVPTQSLALLNNPFVHEQSEAMAKRIGTQGQPKERVVAVWRRAFGRDPRPTEMDAALDHLAKQQERFKGRPDPAFDALASLCHVLLNANEFLHVD